LSGVYSVPRSGSRGVEPRCIQAWWKSAEVARGRRRPSSAALEPLLQLRLILRDLLSGVAPDQWQEQLAETVALEVEPERDQRTGAVPGRLRTEGADRADRPVLPTERSLARRPPLGDLVGQLPRPTRNPSRFCRPRTDARWT